jgi:hypothetical protein
MRRPPPVVVQPPDTRAVADSLAYVAPGGHIALLRS